MTPYKNDNNITCSISLGLRSDRSSYSSVIALTLKVARPRDASLPENPEYGPPKKIKMFFYGCKKKLRENDIHNSGKWNHNK